MVFEVMNYVGDICFDMLVVFNDNEMLIFENVGVFNNYLVQLFFGKFYFLLCEGGKKVFFGVLLIKELFKCIEEYIKGMVVFGMLFEELGFNYIGLVDGYDVLGFIIMFKNMCDLKGLQFLYIMIKKGCGYELVEKDLIIFYVVFKFDFFSGCLLKSSGGLLSYLKIFGDWLCEMVVKDNKLMVIILVMCEGFGMVEFLCKFLDCYFDVVIVE